MKFFFRKIRIIFENFYSTDCKTYLSGRFFFQILCASQNVQTLKHISPGRLRGYFQNCPKYTHCLNQLIFQFHRCQTPLAHLPLESFQWLQIRKCEIIQIQIKSRHQQSKLFVENTKFNTNLTVQVVCTWQRTLLLLV